MQGLGWIAWQMVFNICNFWIVCKEAKYLSCTASFTWTLYLGLNITSNGGWRDCMLCHHQTLRLRGAFLAYFSSLFRYYGPSLRCSTMLPCLTYRMYTVVIKPATWFLIHSAIWVLLSLVSVGYNNNLQASNPHFEKKWQVTLTGEQLLPFTLQGFGHFNAMADFPACYKQCSPQHYFAGANLAASWAFCCPRWLWSGSKKHKQTTTYFSHMEELVLVQHQTAHWLN